jgi:hypothetical protein
MQLRLSHPSRLRLGLITLSAVSFFGCSRTPEPPPPPAPAPASAAPALKQAEPMPAPEPATPAPTTTPVEPPPTAAADGPTDDTPGWSRQRLQDSVPLCVFADERERRSAPLIEQVKKQMLREDAPVTFGVFGPSCLGKACYDKPMLQCWAESEAGNTIVVHSRFASLHKDDSKCTKDCLGVDASCVTPALPAGKYTLQYGDKTFKLQIPSVVKKPCF